MRANVLVTETLRGLGSIGRPYRDYLFCLGLQALAAIVWWPKSSYIAVDSSITLFAAVIALTITLGFHNLRLGAEELMFSQQQSLREWLLSTPVPTRQLVLGYLGAVVLHSLHCLLLSTPILLAAWSVSGVDWLSFSYCLCASFILVCTYRLAAACLYMILGRHEQWMRLALRSILPITYVFLSFVYPASSHWRVTDELLSQSWLGTTATQSVSAPYTFLLIYVVSLVLLCCGLSVLSWRLRNSSSTRGAN